MALSRCFNNSGEIADWDTCIETLSEGALKGDILTLNYIAFSNCSEYYQNDLDNMEAREKCRKLILESLDARS